MDAVPVVQHAAGARLRVGRGRNRPLDSSVEHTERWVLFQSGQFVHNMALDRVPQLGKRMHVLEILDVITALYEFTARMADQKVFTNHVGVAVELQRVDSRELVWPGEVNIDGWCQEENIGIDTIYAAEELQAGRRALALDAALSIYAQFGWDDPPKEKLASPTTWQRCRCQRNRYTRAPGQRQIYADARPDGTRPGHGATEVLRGGVLL